MSNIQLNLNVAKSVASLVALTDQKSGLPILAAIRCEVAGNKLTAMATDKYSLAVATYEVAAPDTGAFYLDAAAAKFIAAIKPPRYGTPAISITIDGDDVTLSYDGAQITVYSRNQAYPVAIQTVVDQWQPADAAATLAINMQRLATYSKLVGRDGKKIEKWQMKLGANAANPMKPAPVRFESGEITILSQPMML